jgi:hypothetical protein
MMRAPARRNRHEVVTIPVIWLAVMLSLVIHIAALWIALTHLRLLNDALEAGRTTTLAVDIAPAVKEAPKLAEATPSTTLRPSPPATPTPAPSSVRPRRRTAPKSLPTKPLEPMVPAPPIEPLRPEPLARSLPAAPPPIPPVPVERAAPMPTAPAQDLASYIAARRQERGESMQPDAASSAADAAKRDLERRDRIVAANLGLDRRPTFGREHADVGGIFQIVEVGYDDARFYFFGFDKDIHRDAKQLIEVRKGANSDIRVAIVRKMIAMIRENVSGDFFWISQNTKRVRLSARPEDDAALEEFIMRDVFPSGRRSP